MIIHVEYMDHSTAHFHVGPEFEFKTWKVSGPTRSLILGQGVPRTHIPLDNVRLFSLEEEANDNGGN